jgi:hypothetical protein
VSTFLLDLRNHAMKERNELARAQVRHIADEISMSLDRLQSEPTHDNLTRLNGLWARAHRYVTQGNSTEPPANGGSGLKEGARLAA